MDISVVSGTYNRLPYLKNMVNSVRQSFRNNWGLLYDIVLVDGGSTDGTQEWCLNQPDIKLIQHPSLLGAVKAFNDGAYTATGKYVIMANDDIEFVGQSILTAWIYMQQNPDCGIGCFYQNRDRRDWHVDHMPVIKDGKQATHHYGQVCIVPKWLGDYVGWWYRAEDFDHVNHYRKDGRKGLHTYAGDNELSSKILSLGYQVNPVEGAKIDDKEAKDDLRSINNINGSNDPSAVKGHHPDSWLWGKRWKQPRSGLVGAIIKDHTMINNPNPPPHKERILYLPIYEPGWQVQKEQKRGLRDALSEKGLVLELDYFRLPTKQAVRNEIKRACLEIFPTLVVMQVHNSDLIDAESVRFVRTLCSSDTKIINWNGDYWPNQLLDNKALELAKSFDLMTVVNRDVVENHQAKGINTKYWQIGWEPDGKGHEPERYYDISFLASGYSKKRQGLGKFLKSLSASVELWGSGWPDGYSAGQCIYDFKTACRVYRGSKLAIGDSQWPDSGFVSNRIFQILVAGNTALCHQWFRGYKELGLIDSVNCIIWRDYIDLKKKIEYYLDNEDQRFAIASEGTSLALAKHSFQSRVDELWRWIGKGEVVEVDWRW